MRSTWSLCFSSDALTFGFCRDGIRLFGRSFESSCHNLHVRGYRNRSVRGTLFGPHKHLSTPGPRNACDACPSFSHPVTNSRLCDMIRFWLVTSGAVTYSSGSNYLQRMVKGAD